MKFKATLIKIIFFLFLCLSSVSTSAQCAMCKSSVESNINSGGSVGKDLNTGILYLMAIPYIILMLGGYFFFKKQIDAKVIAWKNKRFPRVSN